MSLSGSDSLNKWLTANDFDPDNLYKTALIEKYARHLSPIARACDLGELYICQKMFEAVPNLNVRQADSRGLTPMIFAAMNGHLDVCKWLYEVSISNEISIDSSDANVPDQHLQTPFHWACAFGHIDIVQWLFKIIPSRFHSLKSIGIISLYGQDINIDNRTILRPTKMDQRPLALACSNGHIEISKWLIIHGALHIHMSNEWPNTILDTSSNPPFMLRFKDNSSSSYSNEKEENIACWKLNQKVISKDVLCTNCEPYLYAWCTSMIDTHSGFICFLCCCLSSHSSNNNNNNNLKKSSSTSSALLDTLIDTSVKVSLQTTLLSTSSSTSTDELTSNNSFVQDDDDVNQHIKDKSSPSSSPSEKKQSMELPSNSISSSSSSTHVTENEEDNDKNKKNALLLLLSLGLNHPIYVIIPEFLGVPNKAALRDFKLLRSMLQDD